MVQHLSYEYWVNPDDPRAPSQAVWDRMTPAERDRVVDELPSEFELEPPEGDYHFEAKVDAHSTLNAFFRRTNRNIYVASELAVYYPGERVFAADLFAVLDVDLHKRNSWVVNKEGKGLDLIIEVRYLTKPEKDYVTNVERYARLGISEYFIFDRKKLTLRGYRLPQGAQVYTPLVPQQGRYPSTVLGLDLMLEETSLRFMDGDTPVLGLEEMLLKLKAEKENAIKRAEALERQLAEARAEIARLKGSL